MLAACLYCWLTILSTTDARLLIGNSTLALPIVQTQIPVIAFFGAAPVLLLIVYLYLHFSLQNLWDALATLPAIFPDGRPVQERTLPWILSPIVRLYFKRLECPGLEKFRVRATALLVWWGVPFTLLGFWLRFLVRQNRVITAMQVVLVGISVWLALMLWSVTKDTLRGRPAQWNRRPRPKSAMGGVLTATFLALFSAGCFAGEKPENSWGWRTSAPKILHFVGWYAFGYLQDADLSTKPDDWDGKDLEVVKGAQLEGRSLRNILADHAFGPKTNFSRADLQHADLEFADLRGAQFRAADLEFADLSNADLRGANFIFADLGWANLAGANLQDSFFQEARGLEKRQIFVASNWFFAYFSEATLADLGLCQTNKPCDHRARLLNRDFSGIDLGRSSGIEIVSQADFHEANLQHASLQNLILIRADFSNADLRFADLSGTTLDHANLAGTDLRGVDLSTVKGLTLKQFESAIADHATKLPPISPVPETVSAEEVVLVAGRPGGNA